MQGSRGAGKSTLGGAMATSLIVLAALMSVVPSVAASNSSFVVLSATWSSSSGVAGPGSTNVPLTVDIEYTGGTTATSVLALLRLPAGFTDTSGNNTPSTGTASVSSSSNFHLKYNLTIATSASIGTYSMPIQFTWTTSAGGSLVVNAETDTLTLSLLGTVVLSYQPSQTSLNAGEINAMTLTLSNSGTGTATQIRPSVSTSAGSVLTVLPVVPSLSASSSTRLVLNVFEPASAAGSAVILTFTTTYNDAYGNSETATQTVGFRAVSAAAPILSFTSSSASLIPGQVNDVQVLLTNLGPGDVTRMYTTITASTGFSVLNQIPTVSILQMNAPVNATVRVFAPTSAAGTAATLTFAYSYIDPYGTSTSGSQSLGFYTASSSSIATGTSLSIATSSNSILAGEESPVSFVITNTGQQSVYSPTISLSVTSPLVASTNSSISLANAVINPGGSVRYDAGVSSSTSASGGSYSGTLSITYTDQFGDTHSQSVTVAFLVTVPVTQVSEASVSTEVAVGTPSRVTFLIWNTGNVPIYSPTLSLSVPSGLAVTSNSTYTRTGLKIAPGQSFTFHANVTSGPKTAEGAYTGTLTVSYADQFGNQYTQTFSPGFVLVGSIDIVVQDLTATQASGTSLTISGTLLNEGQGSAYYLRLTGSASRGATGTAYVGEVDPNTPVPFSVTVPYRAPATGTRVNLTLVASYKNDYGRALRFEYAGQVAPGASAAGNSLTTGPASGGGISSSAADLLRYSVAASIVIAVVAAALYVRRSRSGGRAAKREKSDVI